MKTVETTDPIMNGHITPDEIATEVLPASQSEENIEVEDGLNIGRQLGLGLVMVIFLTLLTGIIYPLVITGVAQVVFPSQANGSIVVGASGQPVGSALLGQVFTDTKYFYGRPSAGGTFSGNGFAWASDNVPDVSGGSNLGPTSTKLVLTTTVAAADQVRSIEGLAPGAPVPSDLATTSGSGLDPHITPSSARLQVPRVAKARGLPEANVQKLVEQYTEGRDLGFLGEPRVNVLKLNLALEALQGGR
jgi:K+-transporting ATPase ATPase C chain